PLTTASPHISTLFPYTTLFRSTAHRVELLLRAPGGEMELSQSFLAGAVAAVVLDPGGDLPAPQSFDPNAPLSSDPVAARLLGGRSEEHTSELQSRENLVCRLLL